VITPRIVPLDGPAIDAATSGKVDQVERTLHLRGDVLDQKIDRIAPPRTGE
jgi:hypothetical protein